MASGISTISRRIRWNRILVGLSLAGAILALLPIVVGVVMEVSGATSYSTAYASAPSGEYAVYIEAGEETDRVMVAPADGSSDPMSIAEVDHLPGFSAHGTVSPAGARVALIAVDAGTPGQPGASLLIVDLESGEVVRAATGVDHLQDPVWTPGGESVLVTRGGDQAPGDVSIVRVDAAATGEESLAAEYADVLGAYPVAFDGQGRLVTVVINGEGSIAYRDGERAAQLSTGITRDWALSPGGDSLAFVEARTGNGNTYTPKVVALNGGRSAAMAQSLASGQALGAAWSPDGEPSFGHEPGAGAQGAGVLAQSASGGFDVPLGYSPSGDAAAVKHWSGDGFDNPGDASFEVVTAGGRVSLSGATGFLGWAAR